MTTVKNDIRNWVIYKITSPSGRIYIGKTFNYKARMNVYKNYNCKEQPLLYNSLKKYKYENHKIELMDEFSSTCDYASGKEMFWIRSFMTNRSKYPTQKGMNLTDGGDGVIGLKMSESARNKMSEKAKGRTTNKGRKHTGKALENIRAAAKKRTNFPSGYKWKEEDKIKRREVYSQKRGFPVIQYTLNGEFVKEYPSVSWAVRETGIPKTSIFNLLGRTKNPRGSYIFKYKQ